MPEPREVTDVEAEQVLASLGSCPPMPHFGMTAQRAKVLLILDQGDRAWLDCWARIDGPWLLFADDEDCRWVSYPLQHVRCVEWQFPVIEEPA